MMYLLLIFFLKLAKSSLGACRRETGGIRMKEWGITQYGCFVPTANLSAFVATMLPQWGITCVWKHPIFCTFSSPAKIIPLLMGMAVAQGCVPRPLFFSAISGITHSQSTT